MYINPYKKELAESLGASDFSSTWPLVRDAMHAWRVSGFEVIVDTTGEPKSMEQALMLLRPNGRFIMVGQPAPGYDVTIYNARHFFEGDGKRLLATQGGGFRPHDDIPRYVRMHEKGLMDIRKIVTHRLKLDEINGAIDLVRQGDAGRIIIRP
jgi:S-(hydroxymethyl)glutathione dehydrogenase/alcohol dehydrogenase